MIDRIQAALNDLEWTIFKATAAERYMPIHYVEAYNNYYLSAFDNNFRIGCRIPIEDPAPEGSDQEDFEDNYKADANRPIEERGLLQAAKGSATATIANGKVATITLKCPGTPGSSDGRYIKSGAGWFAGGDDGDWGELHVTDEDNILGYGAGTVIKSYTDLDVASANQGWWLKPGEKTTMQSITGFGWIPAGLYVKLVAHKVATALILPDTFYANIAWGKREA